MNKLLLMTLLGLFCLTTNAKELDVKITPILKAADNGVHSYRIPCLISTPQNNLLLFAEGRLNSWHDRSPTILVLKRSTNQGKSFLPMQKLHVDERYAFMDPCAVVDQKTNMITLFYTAWDPNDRHNTHKIITFYQTSSDQGKTWSGPIEFKQDLKQGRIMGFGPGSGLQISKGKFAGRLIIPIRIGEGKKYFCSILYSNDNGKTWQYGNKATHGEECQIAEIKDALYLNMRTRGKRLESISTDGGVSWEPCQINESLLTPSKGCQASVLGTENELLFCGPEGIPMVNGLDERAQLTLWRSVDQAKTWEKVKLLYSKGAGYCCMARLKDGKLAIIFEETPNTSFTMAPKRQKGWMNLSLIILDKNDLKTPPKEREKK